MTRVAIVFDNSQRPETTGFYCRRALAELTDVEHVLPGELPFLAGHPFDLFVFVDDGTEYEIPVLTAPRAAWLIDTHLDISRLVRQFGQCEFLFAAQQRGARDVAEALGRPVEWLPLACDPQIHSGHAPEKKFDVAFVGNVFPGRRSDLLNALQSEFERVFIGQCYFEEMASTYAASRTVFNASLADDINMRVFEALASGSMLVTNELPDSGLSELFCNDQHLLTYTCEEDLIRVIAAALNDESKRERIAKAGQRAVFAHHTYRHRMQELLTHACLSEQLTVSSTELRNSNTPRNAAPKDTAYFDHLRPEVLALIPETARHLLDIGCGSGRLGKAIRQRQSCHVTGFEVDPEAGKTASSRLDSILSESIEDVSEDRFEACTFDCIVLADVLEHLRNPLRVLRCCREWLSDDGLLVMSVPNSRHHSVVSGLIDGHWTYEAAGLLDEDHVRTLTRRETEKLLFRAGFELQTTNIVPGPGFHEWEAGGRLGEVRIGRLHIGGIPPAEAEEFFVYQYLMKAGPAQRKSFGLTSIIIAVFNELAFTKECIDSIRMRTDLPYELIVIDNASTDATPLYLNSLDATVVTNETNCGFAPAVNQGLEIAAGENIVLLNNDCVATTGWLESLLDALHSRPDIGIVGPVSKNVSGEQQIAVLYEDMASMDGFAWDVRRSQAGQWQENDRLVGFCMAFRRELPEQIGRFDEQFRIGCFEDDDFCRRATDAGKRLLIVHDCFVHHYGSRTFVGSGLSLPALLRENAARYDAKWCREESSATTPDSPHTAVLGDKQQRPQYREVTTPGGAVLLQRRVIRLSLCMIVRDNEHTIEACLDSIYPWVDEIVIVDTGSTDRTPDICRQFGARMFEFPWCDDFSAARNESVRHATGEWIFWMDSDDVIEQSEGRRLRELAYGDHEESTLGYIMQVICPSGDPGEQTIVDHVKVFRNRPDLRFEHRIHEQILGAIRRAGGNVTFTDIHVVHNGSIQSPEVRARKLDRDFRILTLDLADHPDHPFVLFNLGMTHEDAGNYGEAESFLRRSIAVAHEGESHLRKAWALLVNSLRLQGDTTGAISAATESLEQFPDDKELLFRRAVLHQDVGDPAAAAEDYLRVLSLTTGRAFESIDPGIEGHKAHHNLAIVYTDMGRIVDAEVHWRRSVSVNEEFTPGWRALGNILADQDRTAELESLVATIPERSSLLSTIAILKALVHDKHGHIAAVEQTLENAWQVTGDSDCLDELCRILSTHDLFPSALRFLEQLSRARPGDAVVLHNLGTALQACGRFSESVDVLSECVEIAPHRVDSVHQLIQMLRELQRKGLTDEIAERVFTRCRKHRELTEELRSLGFQPPLAQ